MKKIKLTFFISLILFCILNGVAQVVIIEHPKYKSKTSENVDITKIELTEEYTIFHLNFTASSRYLGGGFIYMRNSIYLRDVETQKQYFLKKVENIPVYPKKYEIKGEGDSLDFKLYFQRIDFCTKTLNMFEAIDTGFNFFRIRLFPYD